MSKTYFGYVRISDDKQKQGVSPEVQRQEIAAFGRVRGIEITEWFVEVQTAATAGRRVFSQMLARLEKSEADGVIFHKIDRSARNLEDWNNVGKLVDRGIDVQFAHESLDLRTRGGRLSADIMAVVAADYIRNLREEARKGFYGRLKQGVYPLPAPIGYLDMGRGKPKALDPERAPLVSRAFERYAEGNVGLKALLRELRGLGLRSRSNRALSLDGLSIMLNNSFYTGLIHIRRTGETFEGKHPPLVTKALFDRVQAILDGKCVMRTVKHDFVFRRRVACRTCGYHLIGERQKGHVYYRCHSDPCRGTIIREEALDDLVQKSLLLLISDKREIREIREMVESERAHAARELHKIRAALDLRAAKCDERLLLLTDALLDRLIAKDAFERRNMALLSEKQRIKDELRGMSERDMPRHKALAYLELCNVFYSGYRLGDIGERRRILDKVTSNLTADRKQPCMAMKSPFQEIANWRKSQNGPPCSGTPRARALKLLDIILAVDLASQSASTSIDSGLNRINP